MKSDVIAELDKDELTNQRISWIRSQLNAAQPDIIIIHEERSCVPEHFIGRVTTSICKSEVTSADESLLTHSVRL